MNFDVILHEWTTVHSAIKFMSGTRKNQLIHIFRNLIFPPGNGFTIQNRISHVYPVAFYTTPVQLQNILLDKTRKSEV